MSPDKLKDLRRAFSDISRGFSFAIHEGDKFFIKHLSHHDQVDMDIIHDKYLTLALDNGTPTNEEKLRFLIEDEESWSQEDEEFIKNQRSMIEAMENAKKHMAFERQIISQNEKIQTELIKLNVKLSEKSKLMGMTAENYASNKLNEYYIIQSFFSDIELKKPYITEDPDDIDDTDMYRYIHVHNQVSRLLSEDHIKLLAIQDFFQTYWRMANNEVYCFYGKPIINLTYHQLRLAGYGNMYKRIMEEIPNIPEDVKEDPDKLMDYANASKNAKERMEKQSNSKSVSLVGATEADYERMGISKNDIVRPSDVMKKKGKKSLSMKELMELEGFK